MVISKMRRAPLFLMLAIVVGVLVIGVYKVLFSNGLESTLFFKAIGYWAYPIFFGSIFYVIYIFWRLAANFDRYVTLDGGIIVIGGIKKISVDNVTNVTIARSIFGKNVIISLRDGSSVMLKGLYLSRSPTDVASDIGKASGVSVQPL